MSSFPLPNLFIPGVQKAGTTALATFLSRHPDICLVEGKEAHVFDDPEYHSCTDKPGYAREKYASKLSHYNGERYILDATPITLIHPAFIRAATSTCPSAKFIVMLRDPIERALSHYAMTRSRGLENHSPTLAFLLEPWRMRGFYKALPNSPFESKFRDQSYLIRGRYKRQLSWLKQEVDEAHIKVLNQKELLTNHQATLDAIFSFLDVTNEQLSAEIVFSAKNSVELPAILRRLLKLLV